MIKIEDILYQLTKEYNDQGERYLGLTKTKLIKLAYLVEYYYYQKNQNRLTEIEWVYFHYGPYIYDYDNRLKNCPFKLKDLDNSDFEIIEIDEIYAQNSGITKFDIKQLIKNIVCEYGEQSLEEILDFIYFETEPMQNINKRKEKLLFNSIEPISVKITNNLTNKDVRSILEKYKGKLENARRL